MENTQHQTCDKDAKKPVKDYNNIYEILNADADKPSEEMKIFMIKTISHWISIETHLRNVIKKIVEHFIEGKPTVSHIKNILLTRSLVSLLDDKIVESYGVAHFVSNSLETGNMLIKHYTEICIKLDEKLTLIANSIRSGKTEQECLDSISNILI